MSKVLSTILIIILLAFTMCKEAYQCDTDNKYSCKTSQTCCRSAIASTGWSCFEAVNAVCCSDGKSACPAGYICNLNSKRCDPKPQ